MVRNAELAVIYEQGVLRPDRDLGLPNQTRLVITIQRVEANPESERMAERDCTRLSRGGLHPARWLAPKPRAAS